MSDKEKQKEWEEAKKIGEQNLNIIKQLVVEGKLPEPRSLTRKERKALDAANMNVFKIKASDPRSLYAVREDCSDWILDNVYQDFDFNDVPNNILLWFGNHVFGLTYKDELAEKN